MVGLQGEIWNVRFSGRGSEPRGRRPAVIVQGDQYNRTPIATTIVVPVTSQLHLAVFPGNVRLYKGEANLTKASVANVTQVRVIDRSSLETLIGTLHPGRLHEILSGLGLVFGII